MELSAARLDAEPTIFHPNAAWSSARAPRGQPRPQRRPVIQVSDQTHLWAENYDRDLRDILALQSELAVAIAGEIQLKLAPRQLQTRLASARPVDPEAYEAFLKGRHYWSQLGSPDGQLKCAQFYEEGIQKDPTYALAYAQMAHCYDMLAFGEHPPAGEYRQKARAAARKALALDDRLAEAHMIFADQEYWMDWNWRTGEADFGRAMELNPGSVDVVLHYGYALEVLCRFEEAVPMFERARQLDPLSRLTNEWLGGALYNAHQDARAMEQYRKFLEMEPNDAGAHFGLGAISEALGRYDEAVALYLKARTLGGDSPERLEAFQRAYRIGGMRGYWKEELDETREKAKREHVSLYALASLYVRTGEKEKALASLEQAYQQHTPMLVWVKAARVWDPLRSDPRFQDLLRHMNFPQ